jgi:hypothetical protein
LAPTFLSGTTATAYGGPQVAVDRNGDAIAVWPHPTDNGGVAVVISQSSGGAWSTPSLLSAPTGPALSPQVAAALRGDAVAVWFSSADGGAVEAAVTR